jgi:hypothetical protein
MTKEEAKQLRVGDRVLIYAGQPQACSGTVTNINQWGVFCQWDDGDNGGLDLGDMENVSRYAGKVRVLPSR